MKNVFRLSMIAMTAFGLGLATGCDNKNDQLGNSQSATGSDQTGLDSESGATSGTGMNQGGSTSPTTGTKGTSGNGMGAADPTYGGTTGTTSGTASPNKPAKNKTNNKDRAQKKTNNDVGVINQNKQNQQSENTAVASTDDPVEEPENLPDQSRQNVSGDSESMTTTSPTELVGGNPAKNDSVFINEPNSRIPTQIGSVHITGKDKSVAILEDTNHFVDPNARARNENSRLATTPITELDLERYDYKQRAEFQSVMYSRLGNLEQRFDVMKAQARQAEGDPEQLMTRISVLEDQHSALEQRVDYIGAVGSEQWGGFKGQFRDQLIQLETQISQLGVALR